MYVKVFKRGTGKSGGIDYLMSDKDADKKPRSISPKILRGDPELTKSLIDATHFAQRYTSGVLSFSENNLDEKTKSEIMDSFEKKALFPGLESDSYNAFWVEHRDKDRIELHFVVPNMELKTGKRLAPYYHRADMPRIDNWQEITNFDYELSSPKDPDRKQTITLNKDLPPKKSEALQHINSNIESMIEIGTINNRDDVIGVLKTAGLEIARVTKKSISIKNPTPNKQNIRLKGAYYEQSFKSREQLGADFEQAKRDYQRDLQQNIDRARERLTEQIERKANYHIGRYRPEPERVPEQSEEKTGRTFDEIEQDIRRDRAKAKANHKREEVHTQRLDKRVVGSSGDGSDIGVSVEFRHFWTDALLDDRDTSPINTNQESEGNDQDFREKKGVDSVQQLRQELVRKDRRDSWDFRRWLHDFKEKINTIIGKNYDRTRDYFKRSIGKIINSIQGGYEAATTASDDINQASDHIEQSISGSEDIIKRGVRKVRKNRNDELERFKTRINLIEFIASKGYTLDKKESTKNSKTMRKGDDKLVVTTDTDGHGIYFSARDSTDNGSIIDFLQNRENLNLGQVRRELRRFGGFTDVKDYKDYSKPTVADKDTAQAAYMLAQAEFTNTHPYLIDERKLSLGTLKDPRFNNIKIDNRNNALFPHHNLSGACGYEIKNKGFTGFAKGGQKGLWYTSNITRAEKIVICESAIDALSHAELRRTGEETAYISTAGSMSASQLDLIKTVSEGKDVVIATDNDIAGNKYADQISEIIHTAVRETARGKDWNDDLKHHQERNKDRGMGM